MIRILNCFSVVLLLILTVCSSSTGQQPVLPLDPDIEAMLLSISADTIFSNLERLVGFHNRNTASDTVSDLVGVGAARRFIYRQFQSYESDPMTLDLQPSYFTFTQTVCSIPNEHRNVLATLPGSVTPDRYFIVMGHFDSRNEDLCDVVGLAQGANDDCSGTVVTMEMARVMSKFGMESTVILMPVTGEEQGLLGSDAYAEFALQQGMRIDGVVGNDIVGNIEGCVDPDCPPGEPVIIDSMSVRHFSGDPATGSSRQLSRYMRLQAGRYFPEFTVNLVPLLDRPGRGGDHISFYDRGFAAVRFTEANETGVGDGSSGRQHNMFDTISTVNTNKGYMASVARVNIAGIASLALAPSSPEGLAAFDGGDGGSVYLTWPLEQMEGDFSGYMIAARDPDSLYYFAFYDAGLTDHYTVTGLVPDEEVVFSLAAYDSTGNLSVFSDEISISPMSLPRSPDEVDATSDFTDALIIWEPNTELDIAQYRIYRSLARLSGFVLYDSVDVSIVAYTDDAMLTHNLYFYEVRAVDSDGNESPPSEVVSAQLVTHDLNILVVDGTRDGSGSATAPTDATVDDQYLSLLSDVIVGGHFDVADSNALGFRLSDGDLSPYSTVLWHTDVRSSSPLYEDTLALKKYLLHGGNLLISGWKLSSSLQAGASTGVTNFAAGTFVPAFLKVDSTLTSGFLTQDFMTAVGSLGYPDVSVEESRIPLYNGTLVNTDVALLPFAGTGVDVLYTHDGAAGSDLNGKPVGWRFIGSIYGLIVFDFPLYYMQTNTAQAALTEALLELGEEPAGVEGGGQGGVPLQYQLHQNFPNPFNPTTEIRFDLPAKGMVRVSIYNVLGQLVKVLVNEERSAGTHRVVWNGAGVASGVYYYELRVEPTGGATAAFRDIKAMVVLK